MSGLLLGLVAATGLGVNSVLGALSARRLGTLRTTAVTLLIAFGLLLGYAWAVRLRFEVTTAWLGVLAVLGAAAAAAYLTMFLGLRLGPVSVVSPITATAGAMTVVFAYVFLGERPSPLQWAGIPMATVGCVLASVVLSEGARRPRLVGWGPAFAALSVVTGAVSNAGLREPIRELGPISAILLQRAFTVVLVWALLAAALARRAGRLEPSERRRLDGRGVALLTAVGVVDAISFVAFAHGLVVAPAWLIGVTSQSGRVIAVFGGLLVFKERLQPLQWTGIGLVAVGITLAAIG
jgi:drug/metabolite transporter (DMT)-like permease